MSEQRLQKQILDELEEQGYWTVKVITCNKRGVPDIIALKDGLFYAFEVKQKGNKTTKIQDYQIEQIKNKGGIAKVVYSKDDILRE